MPKDLTKEDINLGKTLSDWTFPEFIKYQYTRGWYISFLVILVLLLIFSIVTTNILFALILIIATTILYITRKRNPENINFAITEEGITINHTLYQWLEIKNFWIIYEPPQVKNLYFEFKNLLLPRLPIPMQDQDPVTIREMLLEYIDEDIEREGEPISDNLSRKLKI